MRPRQWTKNLLVYLAFFFTLGDHDASGVSDELTLFGEATLGFLLLCLISGAAYVVNDLFDIDEDQLHPTKKHRPLASGRLARSWAVLGAASMAVLGVGLSYVLDLHFGVVATVYLAVTLLYNCYLKQMVILDALAIAAGFLLRAAAGAVVIDVPVSPWLYVMTSLGALLISFGKRRSELDSLGEQSVNHRRALGDYSTALLDQLVAVVAPSTVVAYTIYTFTAENLPDNDTMMMTIPFVLYGVFRYLFLVHHHSIAGVPEEIFLTDRPMLATIVLWLVTASAILLAAR
jgi:4-hydroxybenzoate polyprenyltransferase